MTRTELEALVQGCPFHRFLRLRLDGFDADAGRVSLSLDAHEDLSRSDTQQELHGGVIASLLDLAGDYAVALKTGHGVPTIGMNIDYLRRARGTSLTAKAELIKFGRRIAMAQMRGFDDTGALVAIARGTYAVTPPPQ